MLRRENAGDRECLPPALIGFDEFQLAITWRVGLHQSLPPLHQPGPVCRTLDSPSSILQPTANYLLTVCLTPGGKRIHTFMLYVSAGDCDLRFVFGDFGDSDGCVVRDVPIYMRDVIVLDAEWFAENCSRF